jgi:hypothetical protein
MAVKNATIGSSSDMELAISVQRSTELQSLLLHFSQLLPGVLESQGQLHCLNSAGQREVALFTRTALHNMHAIDTNLHWLCVSSKQFSSTFSLPLVVKWIPLYFSTEHSVHMTLNTQTALSLDILKIFGSKCGILGELTTKGNHRKYFKLWLSCSFIMKNNPW